MKFDFVRTLCDVFTVFIFCSSSTMPFEQSGTSTSSLQANIDIERGQQSISNSFSPLSTNVADSSIHHRPFTTKERFHFLSVSDLLTKQLSRVEGTLPTSPYFHQVFVTQGSRSLFHKQSFVGMLP